MTSHTGQAGRQCPRPPRASAAATRPAADPRARAPRSASGAAAPPGGRPPRTSAAPGGFVPRGWSSSIVSAAGSATTAGAVTPSSSSTPVAQLLESTPRSGCAAHPGQVGLLDAVARVHQPVRQLAVVGQQQRAGRRPGRAGRPGTAAAANATRSSTVRRPCVSAAVVTTPAGLWRSRQVVASAVTCRPSTRTSSPAETRRRQPSRLAVDGHPAGPDQLLDRPPRAQPG